nr:MAG TPA: hypothetical protein [Caudoviricetes sp.]
MRPNKQKTRGGPKRPLFFFMGTKCGRNSI